MHNSKVIFVSLLTMALLAPSPFRPLPGDEAGAGQPARTKDMPVDRNEHHAAAAVDGVANLPFSHGRRFRTLDEYLAHLRDNAAPIDQPWWREIRPGAYEHMIRMPGARREVATRAELMRRFGFSR